MKSILFFLLVFIALTSTLSGLLMISKPDGSILQLNTELLRDTPFHNFLLPGILLTVIVGGINMMAVFFNIQRNPNRYNWAIAGGCMICGWILIQMLMINAVHWLHLLYFFIGLLVILMAYQLKGKWAV
jgi:uncharacterized membrane protein